MTTNKDILKSRPVVVPMRDPRLPVSTVIIEGTEEVMEAIKVLRKAMQPGIKLAGWFHRYAEKRAEICRKYARKVDENKQLWDIKPTKVRVLNAKLKSLKKNWHELFEEHEKNKDTYEDMLYDDECQVHNIGVNTLPLDQARLCQGVISFIVAEKPKAKPKKKKKDKRVVELKAKAEEVESGSSKRA